MSRKIRVAKKQTRAPFGLAAFKKLLERTADTIESGVVGRIKEELDKKPDREELAQKADKSDIEALKSDIEALRSDFEALRSDFKELKELIVDRYLEIHKKTHVQIERRLQKLETPVSAN